MKQGVAVDMWRLMEIKVDVPPNFNPSKTIPPVSVSDEEWREVPDLIATALMDTISADVPINALIPYTYLVAGVLPHFVVAYFIVIQSAPPRTAYSTVFGRAMHLIEAYREFLINESGGVLNVGFRADSQVEDTTTVVQEGTQPVQSPPASGQVDPGQEQPAGSSGQEGTSGTPDPDAETEATAGPSSKDEDKKQKKKKKKGHMSHISGWEESKEQCHQQ